jgi:hypothetical protein
MNEKYGQTTLHVPMFLAANKERVSEILDRVAPPLVTQRLWSNLDPTWMLVVDTTSAASQVLNPRANQPVEMCALSLRQLQKSVCSNVM